MKREIGPLGPVFDAIYKMPQDSAADVRAKDEAFDAAFEMLMRHFGKLMPAPSPTPRQDRRQDRDEVLNFSTTKIVGGRLAVVLTSLVKLPFVVVGACCRLNTLAVHCI